MFLPAHDENFSSTKISVIFFFPQNRFNKSDRFAVYKACSNKHDGMKTFDNLRRAGVKDVPDAKFETISLIIYFLIHRVAAACYT